ncbi:MAG: S9 family peptidase [Polyangiaceae bacterium]|nr:S9 family peptidase [Polyangiaceae bacterium]
MPRPRAPHALAATLALALAACSPVEPPPAAPRAPAPPPAAAPAPAASAAPEAPKPAGYAGHGAASVAPELLARYAPKPLPPDVSRRIQAMLDVRAPGAGMLSPDGKTLFFTWTITGVRQIFRLDGPGQFPRQMTGGEDATWVQDITPDGKHLVVARDRKGEENPGLYLQPASGGPLVEIQHRPGARTLAQLVSDDGRYVYYASNDVKNDSYVIYRYDIAGKKREVVLDQPGLWSLTDLAADGRMLLAKDVGANMTEYFEWDPGKKTLSPLFGQGEREEHTAVYGAAPGEVLVLTPKLGEFRRLYRWKEGKLTPVTPELKHDVESFRIDRKKTRILYEVNEEGYTRLHALDARTFREIALPPLPQADHVSVASVSRDGRFATIAVETTKAPAASYVIEWGSRRLTRWHSPSTPEIDTSSFSDVKLESYPARDGTRIPMLVRRPARCDQPCPVVVVFHGGPEGQARPGFSTFLQLFNDAGFVVVQPNVRGSDGYGKTWIHADDGPKRLAILTDIEDAARFVRASFAHEGKAPKVGIFGGSYGGYSALIGMTMFSGAYDAGASVVGISNLVTFLQNTAPYRRILRASEYGDPDRDREALVKLSPTTYIDRVKAPLLLIQGVSDPRVPAGEAIQIQQALEARKIPSELVLLADEGHGSQKRDNRALEIGHVLRFFQEHLKP